MCSPLQPRIGPAHSPGCCPGMLLSERRPLKEGRATARCCWGRCTATRGSAARMGANVKQAMVPRLWVGAIGAGASLPSSCWPRAEVSAAWRAVTALPTPLRHDRLIPPVTRVQGARPEGRLAPQTTPPAPPLLPSPLPLSHRKWHPSRDRQQAAAAPSARRWHRSQPVHPGNGPPAVPAAAPAAASSAALQGPACSAVRPRPPFAAAAAFHAANRQPPEPSSPP